MVRRNIKAVPAIGLSVALLACLSVSVLAQDDGFPHVQFITPLYGPGNTPFTLVGTGFNTSLEKNTVRFELHDEHWEADLTNCTKTSISGIVPDEVAPSDISGWDRYYRIRVTTPEGTSNGVWFRPTTYPPTQDLRPNTSVVLLEPGTGKGLLGIGGGTPPYTLTPLDATQEAIVTAIQSGNIVELSGVSEAYAQMEIMDSSNPPQLDTTTVVVKSPTFEPTFTTTFHTLLAGSSPGFIIESAVLTNSMLTESTEIKLDNARINLRYLRPGSVIGLIEFGWFEMIAGYRYLQVVEVTDNQADFNLISREDGGMNAEGLGSITLDPPLITLSIPGVRAEALVPHSAEQKLVFTDGIIQLPETAGETFRIAATFTSVSVTPERHHPVEHRVHQEFICLSPGDDAPKIERLSPAQGAAGKHVRIQGAGFGTALPPEAVTFAGPNSERVPGTIVQSKENLVIASVPLNAVTGPVRIEVNGLLSNEYLFEVRFRPDAGIYFSELTAGEPTEPVLMLRQPATLDHDYIPTDFADELAFETASFTLDAGSAILDNLEIDQVVGQCEITDFTFGISDEFDIKYIGLEPNETGRHVFDIMLTRRKAFAKMYISVGDDGTGVRFDLKKERPIEPGRTVRIQFDQPIYLPPDSVGAAVITRTELVSETWNAFPHSAMRVIARGVARVR